jgi:hypothetical protein
MKIATIQVMETQHSGSSSPTPRFGVPDDLVRKLHDANEEFHSARQHLEHAMQSTLPRHQDRLAEAGDHVRRAEQQLEETSNQISQTLPPTTPHQTTGSHPA